MSSLDRLRALLGKPVTWGWAKPRLWTASEQYLGVELPSDYKAFLDLYGPGSIDGYLSLSRPLEADATELERLWSLEDWRRARLSAPDLYPYPSPPRSWRPHLLGFGRARQRVLLPRDRAGP
ncbi:SMI1/KNR4 family protein [Streptomyces mirabilis]|uniref:SMI1/KNR4 family protein n=1 Tax=Streptomyces mirabilis TaxID=68239 RepID=UPI0036D80FAC